MTRKQIIELINQYIYTNGNQRITAAQLNEILLEIANSFAMENGSASGLDAVLAAGSSVSDGRVITNAFGGKINLAAHYASEEGITSDYLGLEAVGPQNQSVTFNAKESSVIGNLKRANSTRELVKLLGEKTLLKGEMLAATAHLVTSNDKSRDSRGMDAGSSESSTSDGVFSITINDAGRTFNRVGQNVIESSVDIGLGGSTRSLMSADGYKRSTGSDGSYASRTHTRDQFSSEITTGPQTSSSYRQDVSGIETKVNNSSNIFYSYQGLTSQVWGDHAASIVQMDRTGLRLFNGKKLTLTPGGSGATAGVATLVAGTVNISTNAVLSNSVVSLSVQGTGAYTGNIRAQNLVAGVGFEIKSSVNTDTCKVFWQIIDL